MINIPIIVPCRGRTPVVQVDRQAHVPEKIPSINRERIYWPADALESYLPYNVMEVWQQNNCNFDKSQNPPHERPGSPQRLFDEKDIVHDTPVQMTFDGYP